jgi:thioesterase domain-containing protein
MMVRLEARFKRRFLLTVLLQHETLRGLAAYVASEHDAAERGLLVTIQPLGDKPPIFCFSGIDGEVLALRDLADNLGSDRPLYGLRGVNYSDPASSSTTIEQAAHQCVNEIQAAWPHGPYVLAGYSFGGHLALEAARRLAAPGEAEPLVLLIDTYPPAATSPTLAERARYHFDSLRTIGGARGLAEYLRDRRRRICLRLIRHRLTRAIGKRLMAPDSSPLSAAQIALATYSPAPYPGRVWLFKASRRQGHGDRDPMDGWGAFISGELEIRTLPGEHLSLISNPNAIELARQMREVLG